MRFWFNSHPRHRPQHAPLILGPSIATLPCDDTHLKHLRSINCGDKSKCINYASLNSRVSSYPRYHTHSWTKKLHQARPTPPPLPLQCYFHHQSNVRGRIKEASLVLQWGDTFAFPSLTLLMLTSDITKSNITARHPLHAV